MRTSCRIAIAVLAALLFAPAAGGQSFRLRRIVVVGDSILAGFSSGGFVGQGRPGQLDSAPLLIARQAGASLPQPVMSSPGVPPPYAIVDANQNGHLDPGEIRRPSSGLGFRSRPGKLVRNLAVPGEDTVSVFEEVGADDVLKGILAGRNQDGRTILKFLILGLPPRQRSVSQVNRAQHLAPSFLLVWIGNNDVLPMATSTDPNAVTLDAPTFGQRIRRLLDALADTGADMAVANLPDVTGIAALRHAAGEVTACSAAGVVTPVASDDLLSIDLDRRLLPTPPCTKVLTADERAAIRAKIVAFNGEIAAAIADVQQRRGVGVAPVDMFALFDGARQGIDLNGDGTPDLTTGYLGGIFSLDGVHPTRTGQGLVANAFIDAINARFAETIPRVDPARLAARDPLVGSPFRPASEPPFGLIGNSEVDGLDDFFGHVYDRIANGTDDLRKDLEDRARRLLDRFLKLF